MRAPSMLRPVPEGPAEPPPPPPPLFTDYLDLGAILSAPPPTLDFILPGILGGTLAVLVSPGGAGKSMLALGLGICVATGRNLWDLLPSAPTAGPVIVVSAEDPRPILAHRLHSLACVPNGCEGLNLARDEGFRERFRVKAVQGTGFSFGAWVNGEFVPSSDFLRLRDEIEALRPRLVIWDTLNRCLSGIPENDNAAIGRVVNELESVVAPVGAAGLVLHHVGKASARDGQGDEQQAARGAGAITDNARWQGNLVGMGKDEAKTRGIADEDRRRWVRLATPKSNYAVGAEDRWLWRDQGGVLRGREPQAAPPTARRGGGRNHDDD